MKIDLLMAVAASASAAVISAHAAVQTEKPLIGVAKAVSIAESSLGAKAFGAELDHEKGKSVYEIDLVKDGRAVEVEVDAATGQVGPQRGGALRLPFTPEAVKAVQTAPRSLSQTIAMVEGATKGRVADIGLERRGDRHYYEVELVGAQDRDVLVDLRTGAITPVLDD